MRGEGPRGVPQAFAISPAGCRAERGLSEHGALASQPNPNGRYLPFFIFAAISSAESCVSTNRSSESKPKAVCRHCTA